ncbi:MAG: SLC13 family permease [Thermoleophilia bacterium]
MMLTHLTIPLAAAAVAAVALRPRAWVPAIAACALALAALALAPDVSVVRDAAAAVAPLAAFLAAAIWLSDLAAASGLSRRLAGTLARRAGGSPWALFALVCVCCAALTVAVSLDGAVVLMAPVILALAPLGDRLVRPLLAATIVVANAFSIAVPQGNPVNLIVMERLGLGPAAFAAALIGPAALATVVAAGVVAAAERRALTGRLAPTGAPVAGPWNTGERLAAGALGAAAVLGMASPWAGLPPWASLTAVALVTAMAAGPLRVARPRVAVPARVCVQVAALSVAVGAAAAAVGMPPVTAGSAASAIALALGVALVACTVNNLPAGIAAAGLLSAHPLTATASLTGLAVGSVATRHGSVATLLAIERTGQDARMGGRRHLLVLGPAAVLGTVVAAVALVLCGVSGG